MQVNLPVNLGPHTSVGDSNLVCTALQPPVSVYSLEKMEEKKKNSTTIVLQEIGKNNDAGKQSRL